jgi:hypothetical protein
MKISKLNPMIIVQFLNNILYFKPFGLLGLNVLCPLFNPLIGILVNLLVEIVLCLYLGLKRFYKCENLILSINFFDCLLLCNLVNNVIFIESHVFLGFDNLRTCLIFLISDI